MSWLKGRCWVGQSGGGSWDSAFLVSSQWMLALPVQITSVIHHCREANRTFRSEPVCTLMVKGFKNNDPPHTQVPDTSESTKPGVANSAIYVRLPSRAHWAGTKPAAGRGENIQCLWSKRLPKSTLLSQLYRGRRQVSLQQGAQIEAPSDEVRALGLSASSRKVDCVQPLRKMVPSPTCYPPSTLGKMCTPEK